MASNGREPGQALVLVGPGARTYNECRAENEDSTGGSAEGCSQCGKRTCTSVGRRKGAGREGEMGGLGDRLEPRLEWAEGLPGGVSVVAGRQMLGAGEGGPWRRHLRKFPSGGFSVFSGEGSEVLRGAGRWGLVGGVGTSSREEPAKKFPRQVREGTKKRIWRLGGPSACRLG